MIEVSVLLAVCFGFLFYAVNNLIRARFPHPADLAILSTIYYAVPIACAGIWSYNPRNMIFLHGFVSDPALGLQSLRYATMAVVAIQAGRLLGRLKGPAELKYAISLSPNQIPRVVLAVPLLIALIVFGVVLYGVSSFFAGYAIASATNDGTSGEALVFFSLEALGLALTSCLLIQKTMPRNHALYVVIAVGLATILFILFVRSKRLEAVSAILPLAILMLSNRANYGARAKRIAIIAVLSTILVYMAAVRVGDDFDGFAIGFYSLSEGLYAGHSLSGIIGNLETHQVGYENGSRIVNGLLGIVPRFIWPGKDEMLYFGDAVLREVSPLGATSMLAEVVLQGGYLAVALIYPVLGFMFDRVARFEPLWDQGLAERRIPWRFGAYIIVTAIFLPHFRDGMIPAIKLSIQAMIFYLALMGITKLPSSVRFMPSMAALGRQTG